jgi:hypothetical protein
LSPFNLLDFHPKHVVVFASQPPKAEFFSVATHLSTASSFPRCTSSSVPSLAQYIIAYRYVRINTPSRHRANRAQQHLDPLSEWMHNTPLAVQENLAMTYNFSNLFGLIILGAYKKNGFGF